MMMLRKIWRGSGLAVLGLLAILPAVGAANSKLLPDDTQVVFSINVRQILNSELVKANKDAMDQAKLALENEAADNAAMKYLKSTGFDIFRDLHSITVAGSGDKEPTVFIIRGSFDPAKLDATARQAANDNPGTIKITKSGERNVYEFAANGTNKAFATLVDNKALVAAPSAAGLNDALERLAGTKKASLKKEFAILLDTVNDQQSINFVATGAALAKLRKTSRFRTGKPPRWRSKTSTACPAP